MSAVEIDPFNASESILSGAPPGPIFEMLDARLNLPPTRRDLLDIVTAQAHVNVRITAALVAIWQHNEGDLTDSLEVLLSQVQQVAQKVGELTTRLLSADEDVQNRSGSDDHV